MNKETYLMKKIPQFLSSEENIDFKFKFNLLRTRRFIILTFMILAFQYITTTHMRSLWPAYPMYPPIGVAFVMFSFFGFNSVFGLTLGGYFAYLLNDFSTSTILLYLTADIAGGYIGARLTQNVFSRDIWIFARAEEIKNYLIISAQVTVFSSVLRSIAMGIEQYNMTGTVPKFALLLNWFELWISDLNGILAISGFLLSFVYLPLSREKITQKPLKGEDILLFVVPLILSVLFIRGLPTLYIILLGMGVSLILSKTYGSLVTMIQMFCFSTVYLAYFIAFKHYYLLSYSQLTYVFVPLVLLTYILYCYRLAYQHDSKI